MKIARITSAVLAAAVLGPFAVACGSPDTETPLATESTDSASRGTASAAPAETAAEGSGLTLDIRSTHACPQPGDILDPAGQADWMINNTSGSALTMYVADDEGYAYQVLERIGTPAKRDWQPKLQDGTYHLACVFHNSPTINSKNFRVTGSDINDTPKMAPITDREISEVSVTQAASQKKRLPELADAAHALVDATRSSDRATAQRAYLDYLELYRSFDDSNDEWPGPELDGYADVEKLLYSDQDVSAATKPAADLAKAVDGTVKVLDSSHFAIATPEYGLRTHEVMEEFERFDMRGERDFGAHALPVALRGDVASTRMSLDPLKDLVEDRGLDTAPIYEQLDELDALADEFDAKYDIAYADWEQEDRLRLQAAVGNVNELLAPVATMTVIRRMDE
ncbi:MULTISPECIES: EfeM/EfeO family lipoprotein [unclassified Corynebacterium]|uniref:EfeM/EfeO family lipoprotein n=1 Tax=unclassified Corynebacterium TaxID=2624378 RepID=UPI0021AACA94|nr:MULTISPECIES: EfeM/EfeO family lipoprotein [unclassified Corynebacterium]MCT1452103.1 EfeM/EfeO family lipoprotein [Corynebacterium sp. p3-SID1145]MCT1461805.1 EfeM/EfeO family lipoprotein [Corynebacterium sp. p3-SID1140]MDN8595212.1 EfeM/EfeO family lipoprotein [Corynebacterium sp. P4_F2]WKK55339.1 EfeM/EfeO family lipoprotein [Corynebacterium sp. P4-C1]WKK62748.1 EfeM/EfeO family lipoprotein [Corynebacterium sp. P8-C1]